MLTAELWLLVLNENQETCLFQPITTADLCLTGLRQHRRGKQGLFLYEIGNKEHSRSQIPETPMTTYSWTLMSRKLELSSRTPSFNGSPSLGPGFHKRRFADLLSNLGILPGQIQ